MKRFPQIMFFSILMLITLAIITWSQKTKDANDSAQEKIVMTTELSSHLEP